MAENSQNLTNLPQEDFTAIENAVMETERGRWFLKEYAARNRHAETDKLLEALGRIETAMTDKANELQSEKPPESDTIAAQGEKIKFDLLDMMTAIANTKREIAAIGSEDENNSHINSATLELDAIVEATEGATSKILESAEKIQEEAWTMREDGIADAHCDNLDELSTEIYMACSFQDITGQRTQKVVQVLRYLENRLESMANIWADESVSTPDPDDNIDFKSEVDQRPDSHLLNGPQHEGSGVEQDDVDLMFVDTEDLQAAEEMEAMLESMDESADISSEDLTSETELSSPPETSETLETGSAEEDLSLDEHSAVEDDVLIIKEDVENNAPVSEVEAETEAVIENPQSDEPEASALSESDKEALFSTHEV